MADGGDKGAGITVSEEYVVVGELSAPHGVRGEIKMRPLMDKPETLASLPAVRLRSVEGHEEKRRVTSVRRHQQQVLVTIAGVPDRDAAAELRGSVLLIRRDQLPTLDEGAFYEFDLLGMAVRTESGKDLGVIERVHYYPTANDVYETAVAMIPAVENEVVVSVDVAAKRLVVRDIPGLRKDE